MRALLVVVLMAASASLAWGYIYEMHIDFDPPNRVVYVDAPAYEVLDAYVCICGLEGFAAVSFRLMDVEEEYPGYFSSVTFTNLLPGDLAIGDWRTGITLASTECVSGYIVPVARLSLFPLTTEPYCVNILDHPDYPEWIVDCDAPFGEQHFFCVRSHGWVNGLGCMGGNCPDSPPPSAVETTTWGSMKALFR
jgi:hypothetical protein